jgi:hypothetical protein
MHRHAPVIMKLKYQTGETIFAKYLPVDSFGNTQMQHILFAEQINTFNPVSGDMTATTDRIFALWRYRITTTGKIPMQTFASIKFDDVKFKEDFFNIYTSL